MKTDVANGNTRSQGHTERLERAVEVLVIDRVFVMPDSGRWVRDLVAE